ncbi:hypothetical protein AB0G06_19150 [Nonomuraea dietziae]|uniref:hypothetical protein n=1 Tax=Nonomuraea dietziae TaxID=65515 RepID=UPI0033EA26F1
MTFVLVAMALGDDDVAVRHHRGPRTRDHPRHGRRDVAAGVFSVMTCPLAALRLYRIADQKCEDPVA